jgi:hypothetical protein
MDTTEILESARLEWEMVRRICRLQSPHVWALLAHARPVQVMAGRVPTLTLEAAFEFHFEKLKEPTARSIVEWGIREALGIEQVYVKFTLAGAVATKPGRRFSEDLVDLLGSLMERGVRLKRIEGDEESDHDLAVLMLDGSRTSDDLLETIDQHDEELAAWCVAMEQRRREEFA